MIERLLYRSAIGYLGLGLASGLYYRELTRTMRFEGVTQLAVVHTHLLALGFLVSLVLLSLVKAFALDGPLLRRGLLAYHAGMALTAGMMLVKGTFEVLGSWTDRPMYAGIAGLGHILLTVALAVILVALRRVAGADADRASRSAASAG